MYKNKKNAKNQISNKFSNFQQNCTSLKTPCVKNVINWELAKAITA